MGVCESLIISSADGGKLQALKLLPTTCVIIGQYTWLLLLSVEKMYHNYLPGDSQTNSYTRPRKYQQKYFDTLLSICDF